MGPAGIFGAKDRRTVCRTAISRRIDDHLLRAAQVIE